MVHTQKQTNDPQQQKSQSVCQKQEIPEKFKNSENGEINIDALIKSYLALEKKLSERQKILPSTQSGHMPQSAQEYEIVLKHPALVIDPEMNQSLFELGFTNEQVQAVYDLAADKVLPMLNEISSNYQATQEMKELENEFGGAEAFNTIARQISAWGEKHLNSDVFNALACSKDGILAIYKMMQQKSEDSMLPNSNTSSEPMDESALKALMKNPKYWKHQDPVLLKQVEDGFKRLYK